MLDEAEERLKNSKPIAVTCTISQQTDFVAFYPSSATFCHNDQRGMENSISQDSHSLEQQISQQLEAMTQKLNENIKKEPEHLTTVTEFSQFVETKTNQSPEKRPQQPVLKLLSESPLEAETIANESNSELREFKMIEKITSENADAQGTRTQPYD